ncbi:MAG: type II toxin-antitoxin system RelE/ParE family toxin [Campylobacter sp.]|uniref:type II toxin-antitoxin system RelE/ParE family toxin n=1 Tax=Campylobacter sp. TaxID=205 RepID=UPI002AA8140B|nr:type II toxin-antitoxin system RelE/ParE family toxin [Campylobacter sp.]MCI7024157.1 type II toxin-antitoxin system RelE/ParE family toxin [Campylobacter sp.]
MKITFTDQFWLSFGAIIDFIASDSEARADKFADDVFAAIQSATFMPKKHRKNEFLDDENARDIIFKGYVITFCIKENELEVLEIFKENLPSFY